MRLERDDTETRGLVAVASFLNLKKVEGSSGPQILKFKKVKVASYLSGVS
jgi:hypothetical protein